MILLKLFVKYYSLWLLMKMNVYNPKVITLTEANLTFSQFQTGQETMKNARNWKQN